MTNNRPESKAHSPANLKLFEAAKKGDLDGVRRALREGASLNACNDLEDTALHIAIAHGRKEIVDLLIAAGADINRQNGDNDTPLVQAIDYCNGKADIPLALIKAGANPAIRNRLNENAFETAIHRDYGEIMGNLLLGDQKNKDSLFLHAVFYNSEKCVSLLLDKGADINARYLNGRTALIAAIANNHPSLAQLLLARKPRLDLREDEGFSALDHARIKGFADVAALIEKAMKERIDGIARSPHSGTAKAIAPPKKVTLGKRPKP